MQIFQELGRRIEREWERFDLDERAFPRIAADLLGAAELHAHVGAMDVARWLVSTTELPVQIGEESFGQPPVSVFTTSRFNIQVLFWMDGTTAIHQHSFSGAFGVLAGSSIESAYDFRLRRRINSRMLVGDLTLTGVERLREGDVRPIEPGEAGAHALFHLDRPSVSVVVRTLHDADVGPQYTYFYPHVVYDSFSHDSALDRRVRGLGVLLATGQPDYDAIAGDVVSGRSFELAYRVLQQAFDQFGVDERYQRLLDRARARHGELVELVTPVFADLRRKRYLQSLRTRIHGAEHRIFLALLLNVPARAQILELVQQFFPGADPLALVARWIGEIARVEPIGLGTDPLAASLLRHVLAGLPLPDILDRLNDEAARDGLPLSLGALVEQYSRLAGSPLVGPLVAG